MKNLLLSGKYRYRPVYLFFVISVILFSCSSDTRPISGKVPDLSLKNIYGKTISLKNYEKDLILLVFWATWCQPCIMEIPTLVNLNSEFKNRGLRIISVVTDERLNMEQLMAISKQFGINYEILIGSPQTLMDFGGVQALPTSLLLGPNNKILEKMEGMVPEYLLRSKILPHLKS